MSIKNKYLKHLADIQLYQHTLPLLLPVLKSNIDSRYKNDIYLKFRNLSLGIKRCYTSLSHLLIAIKEDDEKLHKEQLWYMNDIIFAFNIWVQGVPSQLRHFLELVELSTYKRELINIESYEKIWVNKYLEWIKYYEKNKNNDEDSDNGSDSDKSSDSD